MLKFCLIFCGLVALQRAGAALEISVSHATFMGDDQPYVEVYLYISGNSLHYEQIDSVHQQASVEFVILFRQDSLIKQFDKFRLYGPASRHSYDFMDLKRYALPHGNYEMEVSAHDPLDTTRQLVHKARVICDYTAEELCQSDIQLLSHIQKSETNQSPFAKNGFLLQPLPFLFYPQNASLLLFYNELYVPDEMAGKDFLIRYCIESLNDSPKTVLIAHKKKRFSALVPVLMQMDISNLPSGNYRLVVEIRDPSNQLLSYRSAPFSRSNPYLNKTLYQLSEEDVKNSFVRKMTDASLRYSLKALAPLVAFSEVETLNKVIAGSDRAAMEAFLLWFYIRKDPNTPELAYQKYMNLAREVDRLYRTGLGYGFETDRGMVRLKYGLPDDIITVEDDPAAPPYEIWSYNDLPASHQSNVKFLFYNPNLITGDFQLLHSNARGELNNPQWQLELYRSIPEEVMGPNKLDATELQDGYNRRASRYFKDF